MIRELRELIASSRMANISAPNSDIQAGTHGAEEERLDQVPQLVEQAKRGDRDAFAELYRLHHARIFRMARLHLGDLGDGAEDAVAETFLRATVDDRLTLAQAIERLPAAQRRVVELKYLAGMKNAEVASALGKSEGAINAMQWRALGTLKEILEER